MESTSCNLCGSDDSIPYRQGSDRQLGGSEQFQLVLCQQCGLVYLNPRPSPEEISRYYPDDYEPFTRCRGDSYGRVARWAYGRYLNKRCKSLLRYKPSGRLLDVGCATGEFLARMVEYGWQVQGVEPSPSAADTARQKHGLAVFTGDLIQARFPDRRFDVITLWDVLEHLYDPVSQLAEINRILKDDGLLVMEIPNPQSFDATLFGAYWIGLDMPRHLYLFSPAPLETMLNRSAFRIVSRRCFSGGYGAFAMSLQFWAKDQSRPWVRRLVDHLTRGQVLRLVLMPYIYGAYALRKGPEVTLFCRKRTG